VRTVDSCCTWLTLPCGRDRRLWFRLARDAAMVPGVLQGVTAGSCRRECNQSRNEQQVIQLLVHGLLTHPDGREPLTGSG
jgi:hypothetical protein